MKKGWWTVPCTQPCTVEVIRKKTCFPKFINTINHGNHQPHPTQPLPASAAHFEVSWSPGLPGDCSFEAPRDALRGHFRSVRWPWLWSSRSDFLRIFVSKNEFSGTLKTEVAFFWIVSCCFLFFSYFWCFWSMQLKLTLSKQTMELWEVKPLNQSGA